MPAKLNLTILTPEKVFFKGEAEQIIAVTPDGEMGVMAEHMPVIAVMPAGILKVQQGAAWRSAAVAEGFLDMSGSDVEIFTDSAEWAEDIDVARSEAALRAAEERLRGKLTHTEYIRTQAAVSRAHVRLKAAKSSHR
jgi:F-type H+-transporting ATPase subunit epsilon